MNILKFRSRRPRGVAGPLLTGLLLGTTNVSAQQTDPPDSHHEIEEIVVNASALERSIKELAQPTSILDGDELTKKQSSSIGETLSSELGVSSSYFGPVASRPVIRGQSGERVRVLANSLDSMDASALSEDHAVAVDSLLATQIEIVRGPATLLYGSGAAGGLVNVVDDRIIEDSLSRPFEGAVSLGTDSATGRQAAAAKMAFGSSVVAGHLDYYRRETDDIRIPGYAESAILRALEEEEAGEEEGHEEAYGTVENTDGSTEGGAAAVSLTGERGFLGLSYSLHNSNYGIPGDGHGHAEGEEEEEAPVRVDMEQSRVDLRGEYNFTGPVTSARLRLASNDYQHVELEGSEIGTIFDTKGTDARLEFRHGGNDALEGSFGAQYKHIDFDAAGEEAFVPPSVTKQSSLFVFEELVLSDTWVLQGSARVEKQTIESPSQQEYKDSAFGVSLGAIWSFTDYLSLAANLVRSERHPNSTELYADGPHLAVGRIERGSVTLGNGFLDKELSTNLDLILRGGNDAVGFSFTGFINEVDDYIFLTATGETEEELPVFDYGQADARIVGIEAEARIELLESTAGHLHARVFADLVHAEEKGSGNNLPRIPPLRIGLGLHYTLDRVDAMVEATFHDKQKDTAPGELPTDSYTMFNAEISYALEDPNLYLFARGTNLGDQDARQHTSPLKDTVPLPGRSIQLGVRYDF